MKYDRAIEKRDYAKIDRLNRLINVDTFYDDVRKLTRNIISDHSIKRWQCLADYRYKEITDIWNRIKTSDKMIFSCNGNFGGICKDNYVEEIGKKDDILIIYFDKDYNYCRINNGEYLISEVHTISIARAIDKGILKENKDYKEPQIIVYDINELLNK